MEKQGFIYLYYPFPPLDALLSTSCLPLPPSIAASLEMQLQSHHQEQGKIIDQKEKTSELSQLCGQAINLDCCLDKT